MSKCLTSNKCMHSTIAYSYSCYVHLCVPANISDNSSLQESSNGQQHLSATPVEAKKTAKPRVIVLGSGWGAVSFIKALSKKERYGIEPTALLARALPAALSGT